MIRNTGLVLLAAGFLWSCGNDALQRDRGRYRSVPDERKNTDTEDLPREPGDWGGPDILDPDFGDYGYGPFVDFDTSGNTFVVWQGRSGLLEIPYVGGTLGTPSPVGDGTSYSAIAGSDSGYAIAAWVETVWETVDGNWQAARETRLHALRREPGEGWDESAILATEDINQGQVGRPWVAVNANGAAVIVWRHSDEYNQRSLWSRFYGPGAEWGAANLITAEDIGYVAVGGTPYRLALDGDGNALLVLVGGETIRSFRAGPAGEWQAPEVIATPASSVYRLYAGLETDGDAYVVWSEPGLDVFESRAPAGGTWSAAEPIATGIDAYGFSGNMIAFATSPAGRQVLIWRQGDETKSTIVAVHTNADGDWGSTQIVADTLKPPYLGCAEIDASVLDVAVNDRGEVLAVWEEKVDSWQLSVRANQFTTANGWETHAQLNEASTFPTMPVVGIDSQGNGLAVWTERAEEFAGTASLSASRFERVE